MTIFQNKYNQVYSIHIHTHTHAKKKKKEETVCVWEGGDVLYLRAVTNDGLGVAPAAENDFVGIGGARVDTAHDGYLPVNIIL